MVVEIGWNKYFGFCIQFCNTVYVGIAIFDQKNVTYYDIKKATISESDTHKNTKNILTINNNELHKLASILIV